MPKECGLESESCFTEEEQECLEKVTITEWKTEKKIDIGDTDDMDALQNWWLRIFFKHTSTSIKQRWIFFRIFKKRVPICHSQEAVPSENNF